MLAALDDGGLLLDARRLRGDARQETMRSTIEWSYRLLSPAEQLLFRRLAVFRSGIEHDGVQHIAATTDLAPAAATDLLASLVHKSLLTPEVRDHGVRYRMLETVRTFALDVLDAAGERTAAADTHAEWMATITDLPFAEPCSARVERHSIRLEREADNWRDAVRFATEHGRGDLAARLCGPPVAYFLLGRHDLADVVRPLVDLCAGDDHRTRAVRCALDRVGLRRHGPRQPPGLGRGDPGHRRARADGARWPDALDGTRVAGRLQGRRGGVRRRCRATTATRRTRATCSSASPSSTTSASSRRRTTRTV